MSIKSYIKSHSVIVTTIAIVVVIAMIIAGRNATSKKTAVATGANTKEITLIPASNFRDDLSTVSVDGVVESASQVDIKSQVSSPITREYLAVGDSVAAGQTIVELQNADLRAQLDQARANVALVKGNFTSGSGIVDSSQKAVIDRMRDSQLKASDAIKIQIGQFLYTGNSAIDILPQIVTDSSITNRLSSQWVDTNVALNTWGTTLQNLSDNSSKADIDAALAVSQKTLNTVSAFLDTLSSALINATKSANPTNLALIEGWKSVVTTARNTVSASLSALTTSNSSLGTNQAQVAAAEAGVRNLEAQLAKTIIRSPIDGKIAVLPLRVGEFVSAGQLVTTIVGSGGLEIQAYASSEDLARIQKGARVIIQGSIPGTVASVAPSVNELSKKVEVKIVVPASERARLVVGQSVQAKIVATINGSANTSTNVPNNSPYVLPIQNVKIIPGAAYIFTLDANSKIVKNPVTLGEVKGDFVEVLSGMTDNMKIVSPVYELEEGEIVRSN